MLHSQLTHVLCLQALTFVIPLSVAASMMSAAFGLMAALSNGSAGALDWAASWVVLGGKGVVHTVGSIEGARRQAAR